MQLYSRLTAGCPTMHEKFETTNNLNESFEERTTIWIRTYLVFIWDIKPSITVLDGLRIWINGLLPSASLHSFFKCSVLLTSSFLGLRPVHQNDLVQAPLPRGNSFSRDCGACSRYVTPFYIIASLSRDQGCIGLYSGSLTIQKILLNKPLLYLVLG